MAIYYNDNDPYCAEWLRNLIGAGHLPAGEVDERDIRDVRAGDVSGYRQCHFFAGIGGWPLALRLAGMEDEAIWTGSCPCQPVSVAGQHRGHADERHLWPAFYSLITECRPAAIAGEQVAGAGGLEWLAAVRADLEATGYAVRAADLPAASVGAPHIRQRLFWKAVADAAGIGRREDEHAVDTPPRGGFPARQSGGSGAINGRQWLTEPAVGRVAHGIPCRVDKLRAIGNAIVPQVAAVFLQACGGGHVP